MSTKIYNGFVIKTGDITEVMQLLDEVGVLYDDAAKKYMHTLTAHLIIDAWDGLSVGSIDEKDAEILKHYSLSWYAYEKILNAQKKIKETNQRDPAYDFELNILIFPKSYTDRTLAMVYGENKSFLECFTKHPKVEEYGWWNNSDKPNEVTDEQWDQREKDWQMVINRPPSRAGLSRSYDGCAPPETTLAEIIKLFGPIEKRAERFALERLIKLYPVEAPKTSQGFYAWINEAKKWANEGTRMKEMITTLTGDGDLLKSEMSTPDAKSITHVPAIDFFV